MRYLSVCSGIEAASKAWEPIGWEPVAFSEIEPFPAAVLKHHWPKVQNLGDMTKYEQWPIQSGTVDLLVGGTPCQSFSVAGLRQGLKDPRGNLMLTYLGIAERLKPRWLVWENVPGVLSSNGGKDFGSFLGALGELGYEWAYRVLDAQWFGVAQRRRRVFVVAHLGKGNLAAKVLFESESVRRDTPPRRETRQGVATNVEAGVGSGEITQSYWNNPSAPSDTLLARDYKGIGNQDLTSGRLLVPAIPIHDQATRHSGGVINPADRMAVRRLTPKECERLQGFDDDHTLIPWRNKPADQCPDGPRYKALGNSMAVPCMAWIGERIEWIENERQGAA